MALHQTRWLLTLLTFIACCRHAVPQGQETQESAAAPSSVSDIWDGLNPARNCSRNSPTSNLFDWEQWDAGAPGRQGATRWVPLPNKYLLMHCRIGQLSNRMFCLRHHLKLAGLLNRTLVIPMLPREVDMGYDYRIVLDLKHLQDCYGRNRAISTFQYRQAQHMHKRIMFSRVYCWHGPAGACNPVMKDYFINCPASTTLATNRTLQSSTSDPADTNLLVNQAAFAGELVDVPANASVFAACLPIEAKLSDVLAAFSNLPDDVLVVGDIVNMKILDWPEQEASLDLPFTRSLRKCGGSLVVRPPVEIARAAAVIVEELFEGVEFVSVHWRRGDFWKHCPWQGPKHACFFPPRQVAAWLARNIAPLGIHHVFLATNANEQELEELTDGLAAANANFTIRRLQSATSAWQGELAALSASLSSTSLDSPPPGAQASLLAATVEKAVCSFASVFFGSVISTFTYEIQRMRHGLRTASCLDSTLCNGEREWS